MWIKVQRPEEDDDDDDDYTMHELRTQLYGKADDGLLKGNEASKYCTLRLPSQASKRGAFEVVEGSALHTLLPPAHCMQCSYYTLSLLTAHPLCVVIAWLAKQATCHLQTSID